VWNIPDRHQFYTSVAIVAGEIHGQVVTGVSLDGAQGKEPHSPRFFEMKETMHLKKQT